MKETVGNLGETHTFGRPQTPTMSSVLEMWARHTEICVVDTRTCVGLTKRDSVIGPSELLP